MKLKCIKSYKSGEFLTKGKSYELKGKEIAFDDGWVDNGFDLNKATFGLGKYNKATEFLEEYKEQPKIKIKVKGTTTHAIMKQDGKVIKRAKAKLHPNDEYDYQVGVEVAMGRLLNTNNDIQNISTEELLEEVKRRIECK